MGILNNASPNVYYITVYYCSKIAWVGRHTSVFGYWHWQKNRKVISIQDIYNVILKLLYVVLTVMIDYDDYDDHYISSLSYRKHVAMNERK